MEDIKKSLSEDTKVINEISFSNNINSNSEKLIGLKSALNKEELKSKLVENLELLEIHLFDEDFFNNTIEEGINYINSIKKLKIMFHVPVLKKERDILGVQDDRIFKYLDKLYKVIKKNYNIIGIVVHMVDIKSSVDLDKVEFNIGKLKEKPYFDYLYFENLPSKKNFNFDIYFSLLKQFNIKNVCFDITHFVSEHTKEEFYNTLELFSKSYNLYFHISDNKFNSGDSNPMNLGNGELNFCHLRKYINFGIIETYSKVEVLGDEMKKDYFYLKNLFENGCKQK